MFSLKQKIAVITGGGSGIGKAVAMLFAKHEAYVHILDMNEMQANEAAQEIKTGGGTASVHPVDVSNQDHVVSVFKKIGKVNILVNNAGVSHIGKAHNTSSADFDRLCSVNIKGVYNCLFAAIPSMLEHQGGVILNLSSVAGTVGIPDRFAYSMSKGAVTAMTLSVARDYVRDNIRCNCISPARVHTPFVDGFLKKNYPGSEAEMFKKLSEAQPIGRMGTPDEIANLALYLCSDEASFITGSDFTIDGGFTRLVM